jgi:endonuclease III
MTTSIIWKDIEAFAVFCMCVAGKNGRRTERAVESLLERRGCDSIFEWLRLIAESGELEGELRRAGIGQYRKLGRGLAELAESGIDLRACTIEDLEAIHGIGPKTSRYFLLRTRDGVRHAALDTHILKWLRDMGHAVPKSTPQSRKRYREIEKLYLDAADCLHLDPGELDRAIWATYSKANGS